MSANTRKTARFHVSLKVTVSYQLNCQRHPPEEGILMDISETGLKLKTDKALPKDAVVFVDLELPGTNEKTRAIGKVVWSNANGEAGVELGYIPAKQFGFLVPYLHSRRSIKSEVGVSTPKKGE
ncbi:MAG TPA: PilZ domain-containing protein [Candidatus Angelobacter sp.]|nr:PilZ domain-containing protein [Candidatus Angelobacter sp.]